LKFTAKGNALLEEEGLNISSANTDNSLFSAEKIQEKELFYGPEKIQQIQMLEQTLKEEKLKPIQLRLQENHPPESAGSELLSSFVLA